MILQPYIPSPKPEIHSGKKITQPDQAVDITLAMEQYRRGNPIDRAIGYYEQQGMPVPDFSRMSKVEQLLALNEYRKAVKNKELELSGFLKDAEKKQKEAIKLSNLNKEKDGQTKNEGSIRLDKQG